MPFPAGLYGGADWAFPHPEGLFDDSLKPILAEERTSTLEELYRSYFNAVELFHLPLYTERWMQDAPLRALAQEAGKLYLTLDYFSACLPLPKRLEKLGTKKNAIFYEFFCQRSRENLRANTAALFQALAVSSLIPDAWFPQRDLERLIEKEIKRAGIYSHVEIDLELSIPPGGLSWLSNATQVTVKKVREKLADGQPWPVRLVRSPGRLHGNRQVIVYACREEKDGTLRLELFEPGRPREEHALQIVTKRERLEVSEILGPDRHLPVLGLLAETYTPAPLPRACIPWCLRWMALRRVWMRLLAWLQRKTT